MCDEHLIMMTYLATTSHDDVKGYAWGIRLLRNTLRPIHLNLIHFFEQQFFFKMYLVSMPLGWSVHHSENLVKSH